MSPHDGEEVGDASGEKEYRRRKREYGTGVADRSAVKGG